MLVLWLVILFLKNDLLYSVCNDRCVTCDESSCTKCKDTFYLSSSYNDCVQCSYTCKSCKTSTTCTSCASEECALCINNCTSDTCQDVECTECIDGFYLYNHHCFRCTNEGCKCEAHSRCIACLLGRYGNNCEKICSTQYSNCTNGSCVDCMSGLYGHDCKSPCPAHCKDNVCEREYGMCMKGCTPGKFGCRCEHSCSSHCVGNVCDATNGICTNGCEEGYYVSGNTCLDCPNNCTRCTSVNECSECKDGFYLNSGMCFSCPVRCKTCSDYHNCQDCRRSYYWGHSCEYDCVGCYLSCNRINGCSVQCNEFYYQYYNTYKGGFECLRCPNADIWDEKCLTCSNRTFCNTCASGFWGSICQNTCDVCNASDCHKDSGCITGCADGYTLVTTEKDSSCLLCPDYCEICVSNKTCEKCKEGFYSSNDGTCLNCSANCKNGTVCNSTTGACSGGCRPGWWGEKCDRECPAACIDCDQMESTCFTCYQAYFGSQCEYNCSEHCVVSGDEQNCEKGNGHCILGCEPSFWGNACLDSCSDGCNGSVCDTTNGFCIYKCKDNFYGKACDNICSANCQLLQKNPLERICDAENGHCLYFCNIGLYGKFCNETCNEHCIGSMCNTTDGKCTFGCVDGFAGDNCDEGLESRTSSASESPLLAAGSTMLGLGLVFIAVAVALCVLSIIRTRNLQAKLKKQIINGDNTQSAESRTTEYEALSSDTRDNIEYSTVVQEYENYL